MAEDLEILTARNCDERHPAGFGDTDGKRRRRRHGDENRGAENGRLLHHLDRNAAGEKHNAAASVDLMASERADELVQGIVTANVLANRYESFAWLPECGGVNGSGLAIEHLRRGQCCHRIGNFFLREMKSISDRRSRA